MKHYLYYILLTIGLLSMAFSSCKKLVEIDPPKNQLITSEVFEDSADATSAVVGIYTNIMKGLTSLGFGNGALTVYTGFSADEIYPTTNIASEKEFYDNDISAVNNNLNAVSLWKFAYQLIYQANACIEGLEESKTLNQSTKNQLLGEAKFSRALFYFNLVNLYGDVPLITSTDFKANAVLPRTPYAKVYEQMVTDLTEAAAMLSTGYVTTNRVRPNRFAALALLSRVYLYLQQWDEAEKTSSEVINSGMYALEPDLNDVFLPGSWETIWAMIPLQPGFETAEGFRFIPGSVSFVPKCVITDQLLDAFDSTDKRRQQWLRFNTVNDQKYYYPYKYHLGYDGNTVPKEHYVVLRLAEQYLIRAEARAHLNNIPGAIDDLNLVRARAGLTGTDGNDQSSLVTDIFTERRLELFCEWGHRWFDMKRLGLADNILSPIKSDWQPTDTLYPIPFAELQSNPFLKQNAGY